MNTVESMNNETKLKQLVKIKRALLSVSDKTNIVSLAKVLKEKGCELISTGGTFNVLQEAGLEPTEISKVTNNPEAFGGRMKTISFEIESALLFDRERDAKEAKALGIEPIDLVVCSFYPFEKVAQENADFETLIENIDIGGPTMVRAAAKNFKSVGVVTSPEDYERIIEELNRQDGALSLATRQYLMRKAFNRTADYDAQVAMAMDDAGGVDSLRVSFSNGQTLRYGENPHQQAKVYTKTGFKGSLCEANVLWGKQLSYNNYLDVDSAFSAVKDLERKGCAVVKHNTPCGLAEGESLTEALALAWEGDPISAFGSVIAFNNEVDASCAEFFGFEDLDKSRRKFVEVIIAPSFTEDALTVLKKQKNLRLIEYNPEQEQEIEVRYFKGSLLWQDVDKLLTADLQFPTKATLDVGDDLIYFGLKAVRQIRSNAIAIVRRTQAGALQLLGMGTGQPNRLTSVSLAIEKCRQNLTNEYTGDARDLEDYIQKQIAGSLLISEAFFPFADSIEHCARYGITSILQPGGSIRDKDVIEACDREGIAMAFTQLRHFKH